MASACAVRSRRLVSTCVWDSQTSAPAWPIGMMVDDYCTHTSHCCVISDLYTAGRACAVALATFDHCPNDGGVHTSAGFAARRRFADDDNGAASGLPISMRPPRGYSDARD